MGLRAVGDDGRPQLPLSCALITARVGASGSPSLRRQHVPPSPPPHGMRLGETPAWGPQGYRSTRASLTELRWDRPLFRPADPHVGRRRTEGGLSRCRPWSSCRMRVRTATWRRRPSPSVWTMAMSDRPAKIDVFLQADRTMRRAALIVPFGNDSTIYGLRLRQIGAP